MKKLVDIVGSADRILLHVEVKNGELIATINKPDNMKWHEYLQLFNYIITKSIADKTNMSFEKTSEAIIAERLVDEGHMKVIKSDADALFSEWKEK